MKAIITDYDYTLSEKFMTVEFLSLLEEKGLIKGYIKEYTSLRNEYQKGAVNYNEFVKTDMGFILKYLKGLEYLDVVEVIREDFSPEQNLFDWSKKLRQIFEENEWLFIVVSSTMDLCLDKVQDLLGFDTFLCSSYEVREGKFTGDFKCKVESIKKGEYVRKLSKDFEKIIVVGDAPGDFKMMGFADLAVLFEPDSHTLKEAKNVDCKVADRSSILDILKKEI